MDTATRTPSTTSTVRRYWALSSSSSSSTSSSPSSRLTSSSRSTSSSSSSSSSRKPSSSSSRPTSPPAVTYIPPLVDAANGTLSRRQRRGHGSVLSLSLPHLQLLAADIHALVATVPAFLTAARHQVIAPLRSLIAAAVATTTATRNPLLAVSIDDLADAAEALLQLWLAAVELATLAALPLVFACLPGLLSATWLAACLVCIRLSSWPLNTGSCCTGTVFRPPWDITSDTDGEHQVPCFFLSGIGATSHTLSKTVPRVAGVLGHPVTLVRPHTYGAVADFLLAAVLPRLCDRSPLLSHADALYDMLYPLLRAVSSSHAHAHPHATASRVVVVAHNAGAVAVSHALARLVVDVPPACLAQLEIFTFGSLAPDFVLPRARTPAPPHIEHFAHVDDPCARLGVLRSIRDDLTSRYAGAAFVLGSTKPRSTHATATTSLTSMEDYLIALFGPEPWSMRPGLVDIDAEFVDMDGDGSPSLSSSSANALFLDAEIVVDRELAERREMAAIEAAAANDWPARHHHHHRSPTALVGTAAASKTAHFRLSWTGLGATVKFGTPSAGTSINTGKSTSTSTSTRVKPSWPADTTASDRLEGLETARRLCKAHDGRRGREVSVLAGYYADAVARHRDLFGF